MKRVYIIDNITYDSERNATHSLDLAYTDLAEAVSSFNLIWKASLSDILPKLGVDDKEYDLMTLESVNIKNKENNEEVYLVIKTNSLNTDELYQKFIANGKIDESNYIAVKNDNSLLEKCSELRLYSINLS